MDPGVCREHLQKLLAEELNALTQLETLLDREHELLVANDVDGLDRAGEARQACVGELLRVEDERRSLCRMMNVPTDCRAWSDCCAGAIPRTRCSVAWATALSVRRAAASSTIATARWSPRDLKKVEGMLDVLTGRANQTEGLRPPGLVPDTAPRMPRRCSPASETSRRPAAPARCMRDRAHGTVSSAS